MVFQPMTATVDPPIADEPRRPGKRPNGDSFDGGDRFLAPARGTGSDDADPDVTARELQALRREMALLRSDYAQLRGLLSTMRETAGAVDPANTPPTEAIVVLAPTPSDAEAARPRAPRPGPRRSPEPGPVAPPRKPATPRAVDRTVTLPVTPTDRTTALRR